MVEANTFFFEFKCVQCEIMVYEEQTSSCMLLGMAPTLYTVKLVLGSTSDSKNRVSLLHEGNSYLRKRRVLKTIEISKVNFS